MLDRSNTVKLLEDSISNADQQCKELNIKINDLKNQVNDATSKFIVMDGEYKILNRLLSYIQAGSLDFVQPKQEEVSPDSKKRGRKKK